LGKTQIRKQQQSTNTFCSTTKNIHLQLSNNLKAQQSAQSGKEASSVCGRPVTSLGQQEGGEELCERGPKFLNYVQHIFPGEAKNFAGGLLPPVTGLVCGKAQQVTEGQSRKP